MQSPTQMPPWTHAPPGHGILLLNILISLSMSVTKTSLTAPAASSLHTWDISCGVPSLLAQCISFISFGCWMVGCISQRFLRGNGAVIAPASAVPLLFCAPSSSPDSSSVPWSFSQAAAHPQPIPSTHHRQTGSSLHLRAHRQADHPAWRFTP